LLYSTGKYALSRLVDKLPSPVRQSSELMLSDETIAAVESALYEIIKTNSTHARYDAAVVVLLVVVVVVVAVAVGVVVVLFRVESALYEIVHTRPVRRCSS